MSFILMERLRSLRPGAVLQTFFSTPHPPSLSANDEAAAEDLTFFAISSFRPKISVSALKTHKGQSLAEIAPVKSNMLFRCAERGKRGQCEEEEEEGLEGVMLQHGARGGCEAWQRGVCSHPQFSPLLLLLLLLLERRAGRSTRRVR